jgi:hypothetical protein
MANEVEDLFMESEAGPKGFQIITGVANTYRQLRNPFLKTPDAIELMSALHWDPEAVRAWIEEVRTNKVGEDLYAHEKMLRAWADEMYVAMNARINTLDDTSRAAALNYAASSWVSWLDMNPRVFLRPFRQSSGTLVHVSGTMGSGKTDLACTLGDYALQEGYKVITNIQFKEIPEGLVRCTKLSDLMLEMIDARLDEQDVVVLFDEVSQFFSRREAGRGGNIQLEKMLRLTRKFRSSVVFIEQVRGGLPSVALELLSARFHKTAKTRCQYATRNMEKNYNLLLDEVPRTKLKFETLHLGGFRQDIDLGELFRETLIEEEQEYALREAILERVG